MDYLPNIIKSLRPKHWVKNMFVFSALIFAVKFTDLKAIALSICAFFTFCFIASSVYLVNDVLDYEADRRHPIKRFRPIAAGKISKTVAILLAVILGVGAILVSLFISYWLTIVLFLYVINNLLYSFRLKHVVIIDIFMVAFGFVLRAIGGVVSIKVPFSPWFIVIIFLLTLFLAIMKRRQEFIEIAKNGGKKRKVLDEYSTEMLDQMANIIVPALLVSYIFFTFNTFHTHYFILTIPLVIYGIFRYLYLVHKKEMGESPTDTLLKDVPLFLSVVLWGVLSMVLLYFYE